MYAQKTLELIQKSKTAFHAVKNAKDLLLEQGYVELFEHEKWNLKNNKYFVTRNNSSIIAFNIGNLDSMNIVASHTDSPTFKLKPNYELTNKAGNKLNTEGYGGMLCATWFDRPLSIAGRAIIRRNNYFQYHGIEEVLVNIDKDLLTIPSLAIHLNRKANNDATYNNQIDMLPLIGNTSFEKVLLEELEISKEELLGFDLYLYNRNRGYIWGQDDEYISAPQLDNLECMFTSLFSFLESDAKALNVFASFDNEEIGSQTKQGAGSTFLCDVLKRIYLASGKSEEDYLCSLSQSLLVSADNAHAVHPNHEGVYDQTNRTIMNQGIVVKYNSNGSYTTDGISDALFRNYILESGCKFQQFTNRSDMRGGGTLGAISLGQVSVMSVDIGLPILAMHSSNETGGTKDIEDMVNVLKCFYSHQIRKSSERLIIE